jgi:hypothetical protein
MGFFATPQPRFIPEEVLPNRPRIVLEIGAGIGNLLFATHISLTSRPNRVIAIMIAQCIQEIRCRT